MRELLSSHNTVAVNHVKRGEQENNIPGGLAQNRGLYIMGWRGGWERHSMKSS